MNANIYRCTLTKESEIEYGQVEGTDDVVDVLRNLGIHNSAEEYLYLLCLNSKGAIVGVHEVSHGDVSSSILHPREVFKRAIVNNAYGIVLSHNHPSQDCTPSTEDKTITQRIAEAGELLGIKLLDHIILGSNNYVSLKAEGLI